MKNKKNTFNTNINLYYNLEKRKKSFFFILDKKTIILEIITIAKIRKINLKEVLFQIKIIEIDKIIREPTEEAE